MYSVIYLSLGIVFLLKRSRYYCYLKKYEDFEILKCLTCKMKLFIALTKTVSFTFNIFFITVIIILITHRHTPHSEVYDLSPSGTLVSGAGLRVDE